MTDRPEANLTAVLRAELDREAALIRAAIDATPHTEGLNTDDAAEEIARPLRAALVRDGIGRFAVAQVLAEYVVRERVMAVVEIVELDADSTPGR